MRNMLHSKLASFDPQIQRGQYLAYLLSVQSNKLIVSPYATPCRFILCVSFFSKSGRTFTLGELLQSLDVDKHPKVWPSCQNSNFHVRRNSHLVGYSILGTYNELASNHLLVRNKKTLIWGVTVKCENLGLTMLFGWFAHFLFLPIIPFKKSGVPSSTFWYS